MDTTSDDDIFVVSSSIPENPTVDPFAIVHHNSSLKEYSAQIINLDSSSSEEEMCTETQSPIINRLLTFNNKDTKSCLLENVQEQLEPDVIDIDADETDLLAPSKSVIHPGGDFGIQEIGDTTQDFGKNILAQKYLLLPKVPTSLSSTDKTGRFNNKSSASFGIKNSHHSTGFDRNNGISNMATLATTSTDLNNTLSMVSNIQYEKNIGNQQLINPQYYVCDNVSNKSEEPATTKASEIEQHSYPNDSVLSAPGGENRNSSDTDSVDSQIMKLYATTFEAFLAKPRNKTRCRKKEQSAQHLIQKTIQITPDLNSKKRYRQVIYQCLNCSLAHNSLDSLKKEVCVYRTKSDGLVRSNSRNITVFACGLCSFRCSKFLTLKQHSCKNSLHSNESQELHSDQNSMFCCALCSYKSTNFELLKSHICPVNIDKYTVTGMAHSKNDQVYCCAVCLFKSTDCDLINSHRCDDINPCKKLRQILPSNPNETCHQNSCETNGLSLPISSSTRKCISNKSKVVENQHEEIFCCAVCSTKISGMDALKSHICPNHKTTGVNSKLRKKLRKKRIQRQTDLQTNIPTQSIPMYVCTDCSYQNTDINAMHSHICASNMSSCNIDSQNVLVSNQQQNFFTSGNSNLIQLSQQDQPLYCCIACSYRTADIHAIGKHICPNFITEKVQTATLQSSKVLQKKLPLSCDRIYHCTQCFFQTTIEGAMNTHNCTMKVLEPDASNRTDCISSVVMANELTVYQSPVTHKAYDCLNENIKEVKNPIGQPSSNKTEDSLRCDKCMFNYMSPELVRTHKCPAATLSPSKELDINFPLSCNRIYHCTRCFYQTTIEEVMNTHDCTITQSKVLRPGQPISNKAKDSLRCDKCMFNSVFPELVRSHKCPAVDNASTNNRGAKFSCLSCPFRTDKVSQANAHKCRKISLMHKATLALRKNLSEKTGNCEICGFEYHTSSDLFAHVMEAHFSIKKLWTCGLCPPPHAIHFDCAEDLSTHYKMLHHEEPLPDTDRILYKCTFCSVVMEDRVVKEHFGYHIRKHGSLIQAIMFQDNFVDFFKQIQETRSQFPPEHRIKTLDPPHTYSSEEQIKCYTCKQNISVHGIKCVNSYCENWYHINCCNEYSGQLDPHDVSDKPDWFCIQCNEKDTQHVETAEENVETIDFCLKMSDKLLLKEIENQNNMLNEMKKIKDEKLATKEEFGRIMNFIANSKSEKINNRMVKGVCNIIEKFINAGVDD